MRNALSKLAGLVLLICCVVTPAGPAEAAPARENIPAPAPALVLMNRTSSAHVQAGGHVSFDFNYVHVQPHPTSRFYYRAPNGNEVAVVFYPTSGDGLVVPADWTPGKYKLLRIESFNLIGWRGVQYDDRRFEGYGPEGEVVQGTSGINLKQMDLQVRR